MSFNERIYTRLTEERISPCIYPPGSVLQDKKMSNGLLFCEREESFVDFWLFVVVNTTILALLINVLSLHYGSINIVAPHLLYIPIVIAAYWYPHRGLVYAGCVSAIYIGIVAFFTWGAVNPLVAACIISIVLIGVAAVVSSLASHMRKNEVKYRGIFNHSEAGIGLINLSDLSIQEVNSRFAGILGYLPENLQAQTFSRLWLDEPDREVFFRNLKNTGNVENYETRFCTKTKTSCWVLLSAGKLPDNQFVCTMIDISDRKRAEEQLLIKDHAISSSINAITILDLDLNVTYVNRSLLNIMEHYHEKELLGKNFRQLLGANSNIEEIHRHVREHGSWFGEILLKKYNQSSFYVLLWINLVNDDKGNPVCIMASFIDITDKKQMEAAKRKALEQIEKNIEQFAILGDHIRNPLAVIVGLSSLAPGDITDKIVMQAREIDRIVTQLDMGWIESEKVREFIKRYYMVGVQEISSAEAAK